MSMMLKCSHARPEDGVMDAVADAFLDDQVVVMPTETQYALSVRGDRERDVRVRNSSLFDRVRTTRTEFRTVSQQRASVGLGWGGFGEGMVRALLGRTKQPGRIHTRLPPRPLRYVLPFGWCSQGNS